MTQGETRSDIPLTPKRHERLESYQCGTGRTEQSKRYQPHSLRYRMLNRKYFYITAQTKDQFGIAYVWGTSLLLQLLHSFVILYQSSLNLTFCSVKNILSLNTESERDVTTIQREIHSKIILFVSIKILSYYISLRYKDPSAKSDSIYNTVDFIGYYTIFNGIVIRQKSRRIP